MKFHEKWMPNWHQKSMKIGASGTQGPDFYDFGRFLEVFDFRCFWTGKKSARNLEKSGKIRKSGARKSSGLYFGAVPAECAGPAEALELARSWILSCTPCTPERGRRIQSLTRIPPGLDLSGRWFVGVFVCWCVGLLVCLCVCLCVYVVVCVCV